MQSISSGTDAGLLEADEALARELARHKNETIRREKISQKIRNESSELRELRSKLREAYVAKTQLAQVAEKRALVFDQMCIRYKINETYRWEPYFSHSYVSPKQLCSFKYQVEEAQSTRLLIESMVDEKSMLAEEEHHRLLKQEKLRCQLDLQLREQEQARKQAYEEFLQDKRRIEAVVASVQEEDKRERERCREQKEFAKRIIEEHYADQLAYQEAEKEKLRNEEIAIQAYQLEKETVQTAAAEEKKSRQQAAERLQERLGAELLQKEAIRRELEEVRQTLLLEEEAAKYREEEKCAEERRRQNQLRLQEEYKKQLCLKKEKLELEKLEDRRIRDMLLDQFRMEEEKAQNEAQIRAQKRAEHIAATRQLLLDRRTRLEADLQQAKDELSRESERKREEQRIMEEERARLLRDHVPELVGYLPRGVFRSKEEMEVFVGSMGNRKT
ncbi:hypothetical protein D915_007668 [Fasciola hepatica]|uniref:Meiosis-specific nuclear structural protein 1 n=1 Tax=Fasciola hepatica TaxID=6192 RepID=A0A4E0RYK3_FASHE|nr:hypothetical protein D915_007668 [Fasciola hepatica]